MISYVARRLLQSVFVMLAVSLIAFTLFRFVGDPIAQMVGQETSLEDQARLRSEMGLNDPLITSMVDLLKTLPRANSATPTEHANP